MSHNQAQNILEELQDNNNLQVIQIKTTALEFNLRFNSSVSSFFRSLKNGLYSFQGTSNRAYFKGLSGVYFSESNGEQIEIIILYDSTTSVLNKIQVITRLRKLLGYNSLIDFGSFEQFASRISQMVGIQRKVQKFGSWY